MKTIHEIFDIYDGPLLNKWDNYLDVYDNYFYKYRNTQLVFVEIGISHGGSLKFWREYFGDEALVIGIDVNPACRIFEDKNTLVFIGSQDDEKFLQELKTKIPQIDVLLDDGGHTMRQQITTFNVLFDHVKENGIYMCEDTCTSYWARYGGGLKRKTSFVEFTKKHIDQLYGWFALNNQKSKMFSDITKNVWAIHYYASIVVYLRREVKEPKNIFKGCETIDITDYLSYGHKIPVHKRIKNLIFKKR